MSADWTHVVTWALVFGGWGVVHAATLHRDRRKEKREISIQICKNLADLQIAAIDFHTAPSFEVRKSTDIAQQVERVAAQIQKCPLDQLQIPVMRIVTLRQRITRRNIDPSDFKQQPADGDLILEIRNAVTDVIVSIEDARERVWK